MIKNNIRMVVQGPVENAFDFAVRLEKECDKIALQFKRKINAAPIVFLTSDSSGRQTATLQFMTNEKNKNEDLFNPFQLRLAYDNFLKKFGKNKNAEELFNFLLAEKQKNYEDRSLKKK
ncbi:hypothetical protein GOQ30_11375 [Flavobacterium sp. TP390]|uniref:Uncharacterized protein n=1 Tax=Flavobacterium profundi TaxID=1774945 RepID=A0A6I4ILU1_9FLAO|nr:hypothetical protein [Flavobacterium profundi]MVO09759.1 hypothetical protein [Flavobacterium profundi]